MTRWGAAVAVLGLVLGAGISKLINVVLCRVQRRDRKVCRRLFIKHDTSLKRTNRMGIRGMASELRQMGDGSARPTARGSPPPSACTIWEGKACREGSLRQNERWQDDLSSPKLAR